MTCHLIGPFLCVGGAQDLAGMWQQVATIGDLCWLQLLVLFTGLVTMGIACRLCEGSVVDRVLPAH